MPTRLVAQKIIELAQRVIIDAATLTKLTLQEFKYEDCNVDLWGRWSACFCSSTHGAPPPSEPSPGRRRPRQKPAPQRSKTNAPSALDMPCTSSGSRRAPVPRLPQYCEAATSSRCACPLAYAGRGKTLSASASSLTNRAFCRTSTIGCCSYKLRVARRPATWPDGRQPRHPDCRPAQKPTEATHSADPKRVDGLGVLFCGGQRHKFPSLENRNVCKRASATAILIGATHARSFCPLLTLFEQPKGRGSATGVGG